MNHMESLLQELRNQFFDGLEERLQTLEQHLLALSETPEEWETHFQALYRGVHSLKGLGGTHGAPLITTTCHALENRLNEITPGLQDEATLNRLFAYLDLIGEIGRYARNGQDDAALRARLEALETPRGHALLVEPSPTLATLMKKILRARGLRVAWTKDGMDALARLLHQGFEILVCARHADSLSGPALLAALRAQEGPNQDLPTIIISSKSHWGERAPRPERLIIRRSDFLLQLDQALTDLVPTATTTETRTDPAADVRA